MSDLIKTFFKQIALKGKNKMFYASQNDEKIFDMVFTSQNEDNCQQSEKILYYRVMMSKIIFELLSECFVPTHFIKHSGIKELAVLPLEMLPFIIHTTSYTTKNMSKATGCYPNIRLSNYLTEFYFKKNVGTSASELESKAEPSNSLVAEAHILHFQILSKQELDYLCGLSMKIMDIVFAFFKAMDLTVTSINLEFGRNYSNKNQLLFLGDEMTTRNIEFYLPNMTTDEKVEEVCKRLNLE